MKVGYIRVSTKEQNEARQQELMKRYGVEKVFCDKLSGKDTNRPELKKMLEFVRSGDTVVVESYSRLARSTRDLLGIIDKLNEKGVEFVSDKEQVDTSSPTGKLFLTIMAGISQFEREITRERQHEGIAIAKEQGKYKGRQPIPYDESKLRAECKKWRSGEQTAAATMKKLDMKPNKFYRTVKKLEL